VDEPDDIERLRQKAICHQCVGEPYLSGEIQANGPDLKCSYCGECRPAYELRRLGERIATAFGEHFQRTSLEPTAFQRALLADRESDYDWERSGEPICDVIQEVVRISDTAAEDVRSVLEEEFGDPDPYADGEETEFAPDSHYEEREFSDDSWEDDWSAFERELKMEARFASERALKLLKSVFDGVEAMSTVGGRQVIVDAGPDASLRNLYRARAFQSDERLTTALEKPDAEVGPPPSRNASAGRMNARGISVFYGATHPRVALAEIRPPAGSEVVVARFDIVRPLRLLNVSALAHVLEQGSIFDPEYADRLKRVAFFRHLSQRMTRLVMPDDAEYEYLATQFVADFLATRTDVLLDGIIFRSAQASARSRNGRRPRLLRNVVLFHKAARVASMPIPPGVKLKAELWQAYEGGFERDFTVWEKLVDSPRENVGSDPLEDVVDRFLASQEDPRLETLRIVPDSITVYSIRRVAYISKRNSVRRVTQSPEEPEF
jgi:RES domain/HEPN/RES N-terminal domain 1